MPDRYLTLQDAAELTGVSRSTVRRFKDEVVADPASPDRHLIRPTPEEVDNYHRNKHPFAWTISEELLRRKFLDPKKAASAAEKGSEGAAGGESPRVVTLIEKTVAMLERELEEKNRQISHLNERLRESNVLQKDLQQRLIAIPSPAARDTVVVSGEAPDARQTQENTPTGQPPRKRRFGWLFGS